MIFSNFNYTFPEIINRETSKENEGSFSNNRNKSLLKTSFKNFNTIVPIYPNIKILIKSN